MSRSETEIQVQKLKESIQTGEMTIEELKDRLHLIIDTELLKDDEEVDIDLIKACESFFTHLHGKEEPLSEEERQQQWAKIQDRIKSQGTKKRTFRKAPVYASIAVAAIIILFFGISIKFQWFLPSSTPDGQQYVITGKQISIETISKAIANHDAVGRFETDNIVEMQEYLGFSLDGFIPKIDGWIVDNYHASVFPEIIYLRMNIHKIEKADELLRFTIRWVIDYENIQYTLEQSDEGKTLVISNHTVYRSENITDITYTWIKDYMIYSLAGSSADEMINLFLEEK